MAIKVIPTKMMVSIIIVVVVIVGGIGTFTLLQHQSQGTPNVFTVSGAINGTLTVTTFENNVCGVRGDPNHRSYILPMVGLLNNQTYHFFVDMQVYDGPGTYPAQSTSRPASGTFSASGTRMWSDGGAGLQEISGSVTVDSSEQSGTISSLKMLGVLTDDTSVTVSGRWRCP